ncbi:MAG: FAD-dependent monooxygenase [Burkholderiales bacterium]
MQAAAQERVPVLIAGAGSTGLALACELGWRGVPCMVVEPREEVNAHPRANAVANRTMEYLRRWGIDRDLIGAGVPADIPAAYFWVTRLCGDEVHRLVLPGQLELEARRDAVRADPYDELHWSPYLKTIVGQDKVEHLLRRHAASLPGVDLRYGAALESCVEGPDAVRAVIASNAGGPATSVEAQWLVGCDGGRSRVRELAGIGLSGRAGIAHFVSIFFRAPEFQDCHSFGPANIFFPLHRRHRGFLLNWDTGVTWTYHLILDPAVDWRAIDARAAITALLGRETPIEVISVQPWNAHALAADRYASPGGRVLIAGDAAHLFTPTGGLGMNTGVSDAIDLAWKLGACVKGFAGDKLMASYEAERRPVGLRNTREAADNFDQLFAVMQNGDELEGEGADAQALRARLKASLVMQHKLLKSSGVLLGYRYEDSPICVADGTPAPPDDPQVYTPVARPGHRAPHCWLAGGRSLLDILGPWFTLLDFGGADACVARLAAAAQARGLPLVVRNPGDAIARKLYGNVAMALIRPDMMVAWRGDSVGDATALIDRVRGA